MNIKYGLISSDSHAQLDRDALTSRMSKTKWGDRIPQVIETTDKNFDHPVERWVVNGKVQGTSVCNCPAVMNDPERKYYPQRWEDVPPKVYDPAERLKALDADGVDGEVLFPNNPIQSGMFPVDGASFELACVRAYNDALGEWQEVSDRYIPLALLPYLSPVETIAAEVERTVKKGYRGIYMVAEPSMLVKGLKHFNDPYWDPLWNICQDLDVSVHWHASGSLSSKLLIPRWKGYTQNQLHAMFTVGTCSFPAQLIPNLIFSGIMDRYPRLKWVIAETGLGWINYVLEGCDHEWERLHLWTEGVLTRPSDLCHRQIFVNFWYELSGIELRHIIGLDNIMWESDYPHTTSTYPHSWSKTGPAWSRPSRCHHG